MSSATNSPLDGLARERNANSSASGSTGPPRNSRSRRFARSARSGYSERSSSVLGRFRITPIGPPSSGLTVSTTVLLKVGSIMPGCATSRKARSFSTCACAKPVISQLVTASKLSVMMTLFIPAARRLVADLLHDGLVHEVTQLNAIVTAPHRFLSHQHRHQFLFRINPEISAGVTAPIEIAWRTGPLGLAAIDARGET